MPYELRDLAPALEYAGRHPEAGFALLRSLQSGLRPGLAAIVDDPERVTAVWVGYDDNRATRLSGARGALPIWTRFTARVRPPGGFATFDQPPGIITAVVDPETGDLATDLCPEAITEVFLDGRVPSRICPLHGGWWSEPLEVPDGWDRDGEDPRDGRRGEHPFGRWLRRVLGEGR